MWLYTHEMLYTVVYIMWLLVGLYFQINTINIICSRNRAAINLLLTIFRCSDCMSFFWYHVSFSEKIQTITLKVTLQNHTELKHCMYAFINSLCVADC